MEEEEEEGSQLSGHIFFLRRRRQIMIWALCLSQYTFGVVLLASEKREDVADNTL